MTTELRSRYTSLAQQARKGRGKWHQAPPILSATDDGRLTTIMDLVVWWPGGSRRTANAQIIQIPYTNIRQFTDFVNAPIRFLPQKMVVTYLLKWTLNNFKKFSKAQVFAPHQHAGTSEPKNSSAIELPAFGSSKPLPRAIGAVDTSRMVGHPPVGSESRWRNL
jgi:hypothetical protein